MEPILDDAWMTEIMILDQKYKVKSYTTVIKQTQTN